MAKETVYRYSLRTVSNCWLGEVMLTDSKEFFAMTDWGNFNYCWSTQEDIRKFILHLDEDYFHVKCSKVFLINVAQRKCKAVAKGLHRKYYLH